ncbi:hypothetical protein QF034_008127 [Streptomyces africanus]|uniref:Uncharacterized protein n=1 Tax=Streptomyces africanus TaxID=231024 RepID=A0ABU0R2R5_9ACTN|nr:hypothetical protein [Streptomyces africanus]
MRVWSRTRAWAPWWRNWAVRVRRIVVLPPPVPLQTRMCGAASMSTAMARPSVLMPMSAAESGST